MTSSFHPPFDLLFLEFEVFFLFAGSEVRGQVSRVSSGPYGGGGGVFFTDWWESVDGLDYHPKNPPSQVCMAL